MSAIFFVLKVAAVTALTVVLLQVPWGEQTLEEHASEWMMRSKIGQSIQTAAAGGVIFIRQTSTDLSRQLKKSFKSNETTTRAVR